MTVTACDTRSGCITCGDEGVPMRVVAAHDGTAICVDGQGTEHEVAVELIDSVSAGSELLVHAGVAIAALSAPAQALAGGSGSR